MVKFVVVEQNAVALEKALDFLTESHVEERELDPQGPEDVRRGPVLHVPVRELVKVWCVRRHVGPT